MQSNQPSSSWWQEPYLCMRAFLLFAPWLLHLLLADLLLSALLPFKYIFPSRTYELASAVAEPVWAGIQRICLSHNNAIITISGDRLPPNESAIIVSNHAAWSDFYLIQEMAQKAGMLSRCRWFAKKSLRYVPFLGWGLWTMGMPLVSRQWAQDKREIQNLFRVMKQGALPMWLISYSEGTRYTSEKYTETVHWCKKNDRPIPKHTLYPRTKGFISTVQEMRGSHVKVVYDVTIAYADGNAFMVAPTFLQTLYLPGLGKRYRMHAHVERFDLSSLPETDEDLAQWLERRWMEKGRKLESLKRELENGQQW